MPYTKKRPAKNNGANQNQLYACLRLNFQLLFIIVSQFLWLHF